MGSCSKGMGLGESVQLGILLHLGYCSFSLVGLGLDMLTVKEGAYDEGDPGECRI